MAEPIYVDVWVAWWIRPATLVVVRVARMLPSAWGRALVRKWERFLVRWGTKVGEEG